MSDTPGRRRTPLSDPSGELVSDPVPVDDDVLARENPRQGETPRRYDDGLNEDDTVMPSDDSTLKTQI